MHFTNIDIFCSSSTLHKDSILDIFSKLALIVKQFGIYLFLSSKISWQLHTNK